MRSVSLIAGAVVERVGDGLMVLVPGSSDVVSLSGRSARVLSDVDAGRKVDSSDPTLRALVDLGIVTAPGLSRRGLIKAGAIGAGAGVAALAMPVPAMASSRERIPGLWTDTGSSVAFQTNSFDFDNALGNLGGSGPVPSALSVESPAIGIPVTDWAADPLSGDAVDNFVGWESNNRAPFAAAISAESDLIGSFTWDGTLYTVTFIYTNLSG